MRFSIKDYYSMSTTEEVYIPPPPAGEYKPSGFGSPSVLDVS